MAADESIAARLDALEAVDEQILAVLDVQSERMGAIEADIVSVWRTFPRYAVAVAVVVMLVVYGADYLVYDVMRAPARGISH